MHASIEQTIPKVARNRRNISRKIAGQRLRPPPSTRLRRGRRTSRGIMARDRCLVRVRERDA